MLLVTGTCLRAEHAKEEASYSSEIVSGFYPYTW